MESDSAWAESVEAADGVLTAGAARSEANHYHTTAVHPAWADPTKIIAREGAHVFYVL